MKTTKKALLALVCAAALVFGSVFATYAYLTSTTETVTNTFTVGNVNIELFEHNYVSKSNSLGTDEVTEVTDYKFIPGVNLPKDPFVRVKENSEPCFVFVKVEETNWPSAGITYSVDTANWSALGADYPGIYYKELTALTTEDTEYDVLTNDEVVVSGDITSEQMETFDDEGDIKLKFTAYAIQSAGMTVAFDAWGKLDA